MVLKNISQRNIIISDLDCANSFLSKLFGLLFTSKKSLFFYTRFGIHTFGMDRKIDVIIADSKWNVKKLKENLPANKFFFWNPKFNIVIEVPAGTIKKSKINVGDLLFLAKK